MHDIFIHCGSIVIFPQKNLPFPFPEKVSFECFASYSFFSYFLWQFRIILFFHGKESPQLRIWQFRFTSACMQSDKNITICCAQFVCTRCTTYSRARVGRSTLNSYLEREFCEFCEFRDQPVEINKPFVDVVLSMEAKIKVRDVNTRYYVGA